MAVDHLHSDHDSVRSAGTREKTLNGFNTARLWLAGNFVITTVMTGTLFVPDLSAFEAISAIVLGNLVGAFILALVGIIGTRTGLSTMVTLRVMFGRLGAHIPALVNTFILIGWMWIQSFMAGFSLNYAVEHTFGYSNIDLFICITAILIVSVAILGHRGIEKLENIVAVAMSVTFIITITQIFSSHDIAQFIAIKVSENPKLTWVIAFDVVVATAFTWMPLAGDFNRYCQTEKGSFLGCSVGYFLGGVMAMVLGVTVGIFSIQNAMERTYDPTVLLAASGVSVIAAIVVFFSVISTNVMVLYSASFSIMGVFSQLKYRSLAVALGVISIVGALLKEKLMENFIDFVLAIATFFIPLFSMLIADYFFLRRENYTIDNLLGDGTSTQGFQANTHESRPSIDKVAAGSYMLSASLAYIMTYIMPLGFGSTLMSIVASIGIYALALKVFAQKNASV